VVNGGSNTLQIFTAYNYNSLATASSTNILGNLNIQGYNSNGFISTINNQAPNTSSGIYSQSADGLLIQLGTPSASRTSGNIFIGFADSTGTIAGDIVGGSNAVAYNTTGADYSEYFLASNPSNLPVPGQLVSLAGTNNAVTQSINSTPIGIVSTNPGFIGNGPICKISSTSCQSDYNKSNVIVALTGQVPTKVSVTNGSIAVGDPIAASSIPGVGELATSAGYIVGYALTSTNTDGTIQVLVNPGYYNPTNAINMQGTNPILDSLTVTGDTTIGGNLNVSGNTTLNNLTVNGDTVIKGSLNVVGNATFSGLQITAKGHLITSGTTPVVSGLTAAGLGAKATITGNDISGTVTITTGTSPTAGDLATIFYNSAYGVVPHVLLTPDNSNSATLNVYSDTKTTTAFNIGVVNAPKASTTYTYDYYVIQ
jgi:hypothetical protein